MTDSEEPKIIVDEDWKSQVENEKEQLRQQESQGSPANGPGPDADIPEASFHVLLATLATQAMAMMGLLPNPEGGGQTQVHMPMARHLIDMIGVLEEKTKGNLTPEEAATLTENLHQLRMVYVEVSRQAESDQKDPPNSPPASSIELP